MLGLVYNTHSLIWIDLVFLKAKSVNGMPEGKSFSRHERTAGFFILYIGLKNIYIISLERRYDLMRCRFKNGMDGDGLFL